MVKTIKNYTLLQLVGEGMFGQVYRAINIQDRREYAVKVVPLAKFSQFPKLEEYTINQINILKNIESHPHIIRYYEMLTTTNNLYLVYQFCNGGTLLKKLEKQKQFSEREALVVLKQLLEAFKVLNKYNIIHRDLKPDNIFFNGGVIKLGDFGFCKDLNSSQLGMTQTMVGSPIYMAPQVLQGQIYSNKADIWSLGVLLYQMVYGKCPFISSSIPALLTLYKREQLNLQGPISPKIKQLLSKMLMKDHRRRISWIEIFKLKITDDGELIDSDLLQQQFVRTQSLHLLTLKPHLSTKSSKNIQNTPNNLTYNGDNYTKNGNIQSNQQKYFPSSTNIRTERSKSNNNDCIGSPQVKTRNINDLLQKQRKEETNVKTIAAGQQKINYQQCLTERRRDISQNKNYLHRFQEANPQAGTSINYNQPFSENKPMVSFQKKGTIQKVKTQPFELTERPQTVPSQSRAMDKVQYQKQHAQLIQGVKLTLKIAESSMKNNHDLSYIILHQCSNKCREIISKLSLQKSLLIPYEQALLHLFETSLLSIEKQRNRVKEKLIEGFRKENSGNLSIENKIKALESIAFFSEGISQK